MLSIIDVLIWGKSRGLRDKVLLMKKQTLLMNIGLDLDRNGLNIGFIALGLWLLVSVASRFCVQLKFINATANQGKSATDVPSKTLI